LWGILLDRYSESAKALCWEGRKGADVGEPKGWSKGQWWDIETACLEILTAIEWAERLDESLALTLENCLEVMWGRWWDALLANKLEVSMDAPKGT
jgi:hypothetical protein